VTRRAPSRRSPPSRPRKKPGLRARLDDWFATVVRYAGLGVIADAVFIDHLEHIALVTAGMGMILFKNVWHSGRGEEE
jgi:hypothetical protein